MIPKSYQEAKTMIGMRNKKVLKNKRATIIAYHDDGIDLIYHNTAVVTYKKDNTIRLNSGGYRSITTKARMNDALGNRGYVFQKNYKWYFHAGGITREFVDGITI